MDWGLGLIVAAATSVDAAEMANQAALVEQRANALVDILTAISIIAAAGFGALALFTDYKRDGKVTYFGKIAVAGILASAVISLTVNMLQGRIKASADKRASERFSAQLKTLENLSAGLTGIQKDVGANLVTTRAAASGVDNSLKATKTVQRAMVASLRLQNMLSARTERGFEQERANAEQVLMRMWGDANRVAPSSLEVVTAYNCGVGADPLGDLVGGRAQAELRMDRTSTSLKRLQAKAAGAEPDDFALGSVGYETPISLFPQTIVYQDAVPVTLFSRFISPNLGPFTELESWRGAAIEMVATISSGDLDTAMAPFKGARGPGAAPQAAQPVPSRASPGRWHKLPCSEVIVTFLANGRQLAQGKASLYHDSERRGLVLRSEVVEVSELPVPVLPASASRRPRRAN
jgi:hypothetical protein